MSAHCDDCGFDLPYEGDCLYCTAKARVAELEETVHVYGAALGDIEVEAYGSDEEDALKMNTRLRNIIVLAREALKPVETKGDGAK